MTLTNGLSSVLWAGGPARYASYISRLLADKPAIVYVNNRDSRSVAVRVAQRIAYDIAHHYAELAVGWAKRNTTDLLIKRKNYDQVQQAINRIAINAQEDNERRTKARIAAQIAREEALKEQQVLIEEQQAVYDDLGTLYLPDCKRTIIATDAYGRKVETALMLSFVGKDTIPVTVQDGSNAYIAHTATRFFWDPAATIAQSTNKDVVVTKVQGRDFSRKELVAGGDISFSVSGTINSNKPGVYPEHEVAKFIEMMQYNGVLDAKHILLRSFGINHVIITDFKLDAPNFINVQPYSFTCLAVEPDEEIHITQDTISTNSIIIDANRSDTANIMLELKQKQLNEGTTSLTPQLAYLDNLI